jgi:hypothetical protein
MSLRLDHAELDGIAGPAERARDLTEPSPNIAQINGAGCDARGRRLVAERFTDVTAEPTRWLWEGRMPLGTATLLVGREKLGKSTLSVELAARLSRGDLAGDLHGHPAASLIVSYEDSASRTIKPRLMAANADLARIHRVIATRDGTRDLVSLPDDVARVRDVARETEARLLVIDPLSASLNGDIDSHRDQDIRRVLAALVQLAEDFDLGLLAVAHWNKAQGGDALSRVLGSRGLTAAVRSVLAFGVAPDAEEGSPDRVLAHAACNLGPEMSSLDCRIEGRSVRGDDGSAIPTSRLAIVGETDTRADDLLVTRGAEDRRAGDEAAEFLRSELAFGTRSARELLAEAEQIGIAERTLKRAKKALGVVSTRVGGTAAGGQWEWSLPAGQPKGAKAPPSDGPLSDGPLSENTLAERSSGPLVALRGPSSENGPLSAGAQLDEAEEQRLRDKYGELW